MRQIFILRPSWSGADYEPLVLRGCHQKARKSAQQPQVISGACLDLLNSERGEGWSFNPSHCRSGLTLSLGIINVDVTKGSICFSSCPFVSHHDRASPLHPHSPLTSSPPALRSQVFPGLLSPNGRWQYEKLRSTPDETSSWGFIFLYVLKEVTKSLTL